MFRSSEESQYLGDEEVERTDRAKVVYDDVETIEEAKGLKAIWYHQPSKRGLESSSAFSV